MTSPEPPEQPHPGPFPPQPSSAPPYYGPPLVAPTSGLATTSLVLGILGVVSGCCNFGVLPAAAILCGYLALGQTAGGRMQGRGSAIAGLILGCVGILPALILSIMLVFGGAANTFTHH